MTKISLFSEANRQKYLSFENPTIHVLVAPAYLLEGRVKVPRGRDRVTSENPKREEGGSAFLEFFWPLTTKSLI
jgi:hypothetical protein